MDIAASIIAVIQLAGTVVSICGGYIKEVKDARDDISALQQSAKSLEGALQSLKELSHSPSDRGLPTLQILHSDIANCMSVLITLEEKINPGKKIMRRLGLRSLKWPLKRQEVAKAIQDLERYKSSFTLHLQIDQTAIMRSISSTTEPFIREMEMEQLPIATGAEFDTYMDQHQDECHPGTRTEILVQINEWAFNTNQPIFWLNGMAGTGKSTISRSLARSFKQANILGASFFFRRGEGDRGNATRFVPTIARQLLAHVPQLLPSVRTAIFDDRNIAARPLKDQFERLLIHPLRGLQRSRCNFQVIVIVIDALDECEGDEDINIILKLLPQLRIGDLNIKVFLTSRPETPIRFGLSKFANHDQYALHEVPEFAVEHDIRLYLNHRLSIIRDERSLPVDWPGSTNICKLVALSVPLFIYASTICRSLNDPQWDPEDSLVDILAQGGKGSGLWGTYLPVLNRIVKNQDDSQKRQLTREFKEVIGTIILLHNPLSVISLSKLTGLSDRLIHLRLNPLHSVLNIPKDETLPVKLFHLSFRDFLVSQEMCENYPQFWVNKEEVHGRIAVRCIVVCHQSLRKDICRLRASDTRRKDITRQTLEDCFPPELQYSCRYWAHHVVKSKDLELISGDSFLFLKKHFLHWIEAMSILGLLPETVGIIDLLRSAIHDERHLEITDFLRDASRFVLKNRNIVDDVPLQLYHSGVLFAPQTSLVRMMFEHEIPKWIKGPTVLDQDWNSGLQTLEGHLGPVISTKFSPDNQYLASSSWDRTIKIWNVATGLSKLTIKGHSNRVMSIVFSPNGDLLASGSWDRTVKLWHVDTGTLYQTFNEHLDAVLSVAFSPDGQLLASGSWDKTIIIRNITTGLRKFILKGHSHRVLAVAFSNDGKLLASGSWDSTVRLWDTTTGVVQRVIGIHSDLVRCVEFSPCGKFLACGSDDKTISLWDIVSGTPRLTLKGHLHWVLSIAFSPDGQTLASGSGDRTVRIWDSASGALTGIFNGHTDSVWSVGFSPNNQNLVSGSDDMTIRIWYHQSREQPEQQNIMGHSDLIRCVAFSRDGQLLASGSSDTTVRLWDTTGTEQKPQAMRGHTHWVISVAFTPDSQTLASGSGDGTIKLWKTTTGALRQTLVGHTDFVMSVKFSSDGVSLASGSRDGTVRLWNTSSGVQKHIFRCPSDIILSVQFSPDSRYLISGSSRTACMWDTRTGELLRAFDRHSEAVTSVAISHDSNFLASVDGHIRNSDFRENTIRIWSIRTGELERVLTVKGPVTHLEFSGDDSHLTTNLGSLRIQPEYRNNTSNIKPLQHTDLSILNGPWLSLHGQRMLRLPSEFWTGFLAIKDNTLALGHPSGQMFFMYFDEDMI